MLFIGNLDVKNQDGTTRKMSAKECAEFRAKERQKAEAAAAAADDEAADDAPKKKGRK